MVDPKPDPMGVLLTVFVLLVITTAATSTLI